MPTNLNECFCFFKEEWVRILPQNCERLIKSYAEKHFKSFMSKVVLLATESCAVLTAHGVFHTDVYGH